MKNAFSETLRVFASSFSGNLTEIFRTHILQNTYFAAKKCAIAFVLSLTAENENGVINFG